jgi:hypothetical protein
MFMGQLTYPMILAVGYDLAREVSLGMAKQRNTIQLSALDYSENTVNIIKFVTQTWYFDILKVYSSNITPVPDAMRKAASAVYKSLSEVNNALSGIFKTQEVISVKFSEEEMNSQEPTSQEQEPTERTVDVHVFLVYVVGLYLNLRLLGPAYAEFVSNLLKEQGDKLFDFLETKFVHPKYGPDFNQALREELDQFLLHQSQSKDENLLTLQKRLNKIAKTTNLKDELKTNLKTFKNRFLTVFSEDLNMSSKYPTLSGYLCSLISHKKLMKHHKEVLGSAINLLQKNLDDAIVELCLKGIESLLLLPEKKKETQESSNNNVGRETSNKVLIRDVLRKDVEANYRESIIMLYAKLSIFYNIPNSKELKIASKIPIYLNKKEFINSVTSSSVIESTDMKACVKIREDALKEPLKIICEDKIEFLSRQVADVDPIKFSAELSSMIIYIFLASDNPGVVVGIRDLCRNTLQWLEKEIGNKKEMEAPHYEILACLTLYAAVFDIAPCPLIVSICSIREKIDPKKYESALDKFVIIPSARENINQEQYGLALNKSIRIPRALVSAFYNQQAQALTEAPRVNVNRNNWFNKKSVLVVEVEREDRNKSLKSLKSLKLKLFANKPEDSQQISEEISPLSFHAKNIKKKRSNRQLSVSFESGSLSLNQDDSPKNKSKPG